MNSEEAAVVAAEINAQAAVAEAQIAAQASVAEAQTSEAGETERAQLLAQALQMRDDDRARMSALESQIAEVRAQLEGLTMATAVAVAEVAAEAAEAQVVAEEAQAAAEEPSDGIPELDTAGGVDVEATPPSGGPAEAPAVPEGPRRAGHGTRHQRMHARRFGRA